MFNMTLWVATTFAYFFVHLIFIACSGDKPYWENADWNNWCVFKKHLKRLSLIALLCFPFNFNDTIITVLGNAESKKDILSLCSVYQKAGGKAFSFIGIFSYQEAGSDAIVAIGVTSYQYSQKGFVLTTFGVAGYQYTNSEGENNDTVVCFGCSLYQKSMGDTVVLFGISLYQDAHNVAYIFSGIAGYQNSEIGSNIGIGLSLFQESSHATRTFLGLAVYQKTPTQQRWGGVWSHLVEDEKDPVLNTPTTSEEKK